MELYEAMLGHFGPQHWWPSRAELPPHDRKLEICVGAVLTQNTNWRNVEKALAGLIEAGLMGVSALEAVDTDELARRIRPAGYFNVKARRLKSFVADVAARTGGDLEAYLARPLGPLREGLLAVHGIGPETADSICLYAAGKATFVVDAYTRRALLRHGLIDARAGYDEIKSLFESHVPARARLYNEYHAQWVAVGKTYCRPTARCRDCPLARFPHDAERG